MYSWCFPKKWMLKFRKFFPSWRHNGQEKWPLEGSVVFNLDSKWTFAKCGILDELETVNWHKSHQKLRLFPPPDTDIELSNDWRDFFGVLTFSSSGNSTSVFIGVTGASVFTATEEATRDCVGVLGRATSQTEIADGKSAATFSFLIAAWDASSSWVHFSP